jgi:hypothetical protein
MIYSISDTTSGLWLLRLCRILFFYEIQDAGAMMEGTAPSSEMHIAPQWYHQTIPVGMWSGGEQK